jgi:hypothetical protein
LSQHVLELFRRISAFFGVLLSQKVTTRDVGGLWMSSTLQKRTNDYQQITMLLSKHDIPGLRQLITVAL